MNLVANGVEAMGDSGVMRVSTRNQDVDIAILKLGAGGSGGVDGIAVRLSVSHRLILVFTSLSRLISNVFISALCGFASAG